MAILSRLLGTTVRNHVPASPVDDAAASEAETAPLLPEGDDAEAPLEREEQAHGQAWKREHRDIELQLKWLSKPVSGERALCRAASLLPRLIERDHLDEPRAGELDDFGQHVKLALDGWSGERLVALQYNLGELLRAKTQFEEFPPGQKTHLDPLGDGEVVAHLDVLSHVLTRTMSVRGIHEPAPEKLMLRMASNIVDIEVLWRWLQEQKVNEEDLATAFAKWPGAQLRTIVARRDANPFKYERLAQAAEAAIEARSPGVAAHRPGAAPDAPAAGSHRRFVDTGTEPQLAAPGESGRAFVDRYTTWGRGYSLGAMLDTALCWLTLSEPARRLGNWVQHGHDTGLRYMAGAAIKGFASITGAAAHLVASTVSVAETIVVNTASAVGHTLATAAYGVAGGAAKLAGRVSPVADHAGNVLLGKARRAAHGISLVSRKDRQREVPMHRVERAGKLALLARITASTTADVRAMALPAGFSRATSADIPREILSLEGGGTGEVAKLRFDRERGVLTSDRWSGLMIGVYLEEDAQGNGVAWHLSFAGTKASRPATLKSDVAQSFFGIEDSAFREADAIVAAFVKRHGAGKVKLQGHSLGGALAQWAGIRNSGGDRPVEVTCFNGAGLHVAMRNRLGAQLIARSRVLHFNTREFLSQVAEGARSPFLGAQIGRRYMVPDSKGHKLGAHIDGLSRMAPRKAQQLGLPVALVREAATVRADQPMTVLGRGAVSPVYKAVATLHDGTRFPGALKYDGTSRDNTPNAALRNVATWKLDQALGMNVIAETHLVVGNGPLGVILEVARGTPPSSVGDRKLDVSADIAAALEADPEALADFARRQGFVGARVEHSTEAGAAGAEVHRHRIVVVNQLPISAKDPEMGMNELPSLNPVNFETDSNLWKELVQLQWLDALVGHRDRHSGNYFVWRDRDGVSHVTGIDNDETFDGDLLDPRANTAPHAARLPKVIDRETWRRLLALTGSQIDEACAGLSPQEIAATKARLTVIQKALQSLGDDPLTGKIMDPGTDWTQDTDARRLLGVDEFASNVEKRGIGRAMTEAGKASYVARNWSDYEGPRHGGARVPVFHPDRFLEFARSRSRAAPAQELRVGPEPAVA